MTKRFRGLRDAFVKSALSAGWLACLGFMVWQGVPWLWQLPERQVRQYQNSLEPGQELSAQEAAELVDQYRNTLMHGIGIAGAIGIGGLLLLYFRNSDQITRNMGELIHLANRNTEIANRHAEAAAKHIDVASRRLKLDADTINHNFELAESRLLAERFARAIELLANQNSVHIRLGGIYSLEKIARDSPSDQWTVIEVLTAFVREKSRQLRVTPMELPMPLTVDGEKSTDQWIEMAAEIPLEKVNADIQAAMTVIGRRVVIEQDGQVNDQDRINLNQAKLSGLVMRGPETANLSGANLTGADLRGADLTGAILVGADLTGAVLNGAMLSWAVMRRAVMRGALLSKTVLFKADLREAVLFNADLNEAVLSWADFSWAVLSKANLRNTNFSEAVLMHTDLSEANLTKAVLSCADLQGSNLCRAVLRGADLGEANLSGADLRGANLSGAICHRIKWDEKTRWPSPKALRKALHLPTALKQKLGLEVAPPERPSVRLKHKHRDLH
jgi:uncharacterized protein YjbI with pentapeptide repeats